MEDEERKPEKGFHKLGGKKTSYSGEIGDILSNPENIKQIKSFTFSLIDALEQYEKSIEINISSMYKEIREEIMKYHGDPSFTDWKIISFMIQKNFSSFIKTPFFDSLSKENKNHPFILLNKDIGKIFDELLFDMLIKGIQKDVIGYIREIYFSKTQKGGEGIEKDISHILLIQNKLKHFLSMFKFSDLDFTFWKWGKNTMIDPLIRQRIFLKLPKELFSGWEENIGIKHLIMLRIIFEYVDVFPKADQIRRNIIKMINALIVGIKQGRTTKDGLQQYIEIWYEKIRYGSKDDREQLQDISLDDVLWISNNPGEILLGGREKYVAKLFDLIEHASNIDEIIDIIQYKILPLQLFQGDEGFFKISEDSERSYWKSQVYSLRELKLFLDGSKVSTSFKKEIFYDPKNKKSYSVSINVNDEKAYIQEIIGKLADVYGIQEKIRSLVSDTYFGWNNGMFHDN